MSNLIKDNKIDNKKIQSFEYEKTAVSDGNIIGTCELGTATIELLNNTNEYSEIKGSWIETIHGSFYVTKVEPVQEKVNIKLECYDIKYKLDTLFDNKLYTNFPCTLMELRNEIFDNCGVSHDDTPFPNSNLILESLPYFEEGISNRNVISIIAQAGCSFVDTDEFDKFYFKYFSDVTYEVNDYQELTTEKVLTPKVNTVVLGRGDTEDNVYYPEDIPDEERVTFRIDNNYILDPQSVDETAADQRYKNIKPLYDHLIDTQYLVFSMKTNTMENKLKIKLGEKVKYKDIWGNTIEAPIMRKKITFLGGDASANNNYSLEISAEEIKETSTDFRYASTVEDKIKRTEILVDKQNNEILARVKEAEDKLSQIQIDSEGINQKVEEIEYIKNNTVIDIKREYRIDKTEEWLNNYPETNEQVYSRDKLIYKDGHYSYTSEAKITGERGLDGIAGANGTSSYFHIRYSENEDGLDMTVNPTVKSKYMGISITNNIEPPTEYQDYSWILIKGQDGIPGTSGIDGTSSYLHIMYSEDKETFTPADEEYKEGKRPSAWYGQYVDYIEEDSKDFNRYNWYKFTGDIDDLLTNMQSNINKTSSLVNENYNKLNEKIESCVKPEDLDKLLQSVEMKLTETEATITIIKEHQESNTATSIKTTNGFTFNNEGLKIESSESKISNIIDNKSMSIQDTNSKEELLFAGFKPDKEESIVETKNIVIKKYLTIAGTRVEQYNNQNFGKGTGFFNLKVGEE